MFNIIKSSIQKTSSDSSFVAKLLLLHLIFFQLSANAFTEPSNTYQKINSDKNPVLNADSLKKITPKRFVRSSLNTLSENIYFSSLNTYFFVSSILNIQNDEKIETNLEEILGINEFYNGNHNLSLKLLSHAFINTEDSLQKANICLNLIKISYLDNRLTEAMRFVKTAKDSLQRFYSINERYDLVFTEAKIALTQGLTAKAENLIISRVLPMSNRAKGKHNEFNCYLFLGKVYLKAKKLTQAKWFFIQANSIAINQHYIEGEIETSLLLAKTKIKVGDNAVALQDLARAKKLIDDEHSIYLADLRELTRLAKQ
ncbi:hypothetical protein [Pedobacter arcticus]|uniref:hypothetical protein n=1 Tax=Pedobacter arcticus TaxID=752140 RepID=UPI0002F8C838|nr:hypothetical protein [Pedobacter arcticus]